MSQAGANTGGGGGGSGINQIDGNSGSATGSTINILGLGETITAASGDTVTIFSPRTAELIVDATADFGTHQTIAAALAAASSGDTIFIRPGTYTENLTLKAGVNLTAYTSNSEIGSPVSITGTHTYSGSGHAVFSNIRFNTNSNPILTVSGSTNSFVEFYNCFFNVSNDQGLVLTSTDSSSRIECYNCRGELGALADEFHSITGAGSLTYENCHFENAGGTTRAVYASTGPTEFLVKNSYLEIPLSITANSMQAEFTQFVYSDNEPIALSGSGDATLVECYINSGNTHECIANNSSGDVTLRNCSLVTGNVNAITGTGNVVISGIRNDGIIFGSNVDFSGGKTIAGQVTTDGQLLIGSTSAPNIRVGTLASADGSVTITNGAGTIDLSASGSTPDPYGTVSLIDDFLGGLDTTNSSYSVLGWQALTNGTGSLATYTSTLFTFVDTAHPGVIYLATGTTSTGRSQLQCADVLQLGGGAITATFVCKLESLSNGTDTFTIIMGFVDESTTTTITNGIYFSYTHSVNSGAWVINSVASSSATTGNTANTADTNWHKYEIRVNAGATSVAFYIDDVEVSNSPLTTNIPTALIGPRLGIYKSSGTSRSNIYMDLYTFDQTLTSSRY